MKPFLLAGISLCILLLLPAPQSFAYTENTRFELEAERSISLSKPESEFLNLRQQYQLALDKKDEGLQASLLKEMGTLCFHLGHYAQAMEYYLNARKLLEANGDQSLLAALYNELGTLYYYNKNIDKVKSSHQAALQLYTRLKDERGIAETYGALGHFYEKQQQYDSAFHYQHMALLQYLKVSDIAGEADIYENLGSIHEDLGRYDSALLYFNQAINLYKNLAPSLQTIKTYNNLGDVYRKTAQYGPALLHTRKALEIALSLDEPYEISSAYRDLARAYNLMGQNDSAFHYAEIARSVLLQVYSIENSRQMSFFQTMYEVEKKNTTISRLEQKRSVNRIIAVTACIMLVLVMLSVFFIMSRQKLRRQSAMAQAEHERLVLEAKSRMLEAELKSRALEEEALKTRLQNEQLEQEKLAISLRNAALEELQLKQQLETGTRALSTHALHVIQKNQLLEDLKGNLELMVRDDKRDHKKQMREVIQRISQSFNNDEHWEDFRSSFEQVHNTFFENLKQANPNLSPTDLRLISLLKMNLNSQEIATMLGISLDSLRVSRYRLRKKLNIEQGGSLSSFLQSI
ncbi:tetratricopeptide repeat protein [Edaphocola aurantiacus]|uniref:tetratricopeptide repeat protein n=1 Tax=Edaphocola aurantiacus TaxID=2601682 RepID=UPI001C9809A3|nr:tetratricopeptide repeat protein [Edaphocola aurantiacus]